MTLQEITTPQTGLTGCIGDVIMKYKEVTNTTNEPNNTTHQGKFLPCFIASLYFLLPFRADIELDADLQHLGTCGPQPSWEKRRL